MIDRTFNVLFLCTGNSARSVLAEAILNHRGRGRFRALSAGSHPKGAVHPGVLELLRRMDYPTTGLRSKSWDEFAGPGAASIDFVITVCDSAAGEMCPVWPGRPVIAHWGMPDPAAAAESQQAQAFRDAFTALEQRIKLFIDLPLESLDGLTLKAHMTQIGGSSAEA